MIKVPGYGLTDAAATAKLILINVMDPIPSMKSYVTLKYQAK